MDVLMISFVAALLAAWSDKTQLVTAMLAERTQRPFRVLAGKEQVVPWCGFPPTGVAGSIQGGIT